MNNQPEAPAARPRQVSFAADVCVGCECECDCGQPLQLHRAPEGVARPGRVWEEQWREQESLWRDVARNARANVTGMSIPSPFVFGGGSVVAEGGVEGGMSRDLPD